MNTQEINLQTLPANSSSRSFLNAKHYGFKFKAAEKRLQERLEKKDEIIQDIGERPKPFKTILSLICIGIAIVFAYIEAKNVETTIVGATGMSSTAATIVGIAFAAAGLIAGHLLATSWQRDEYTQRNKPTPLFYIGLAFTLVYLTGQYYLASRAGIGTGEEMQETVTTMKWFVLGIAVSEVLFGLAFLGTAIKVITLQVANLKIRSARNKMNTYSKACEEAWDRYSFENNSHNLQNQTPAIIDARRFYNDGGYAPENNVNNTQNN